MAPIIKELADRGDIFSLLRILRTHPDPDFRIQAALSLSQLSHPDLIEGLIRSILDDPDEEVSNEAHRALVMQLGQTEAETAITAYGEVDGVLPYEKEASEFHSPAWGDQDEENEWTEEDGQDEDQDGAQDGARPFFEVPVEFFSGVPVTFWDDSHLTSIILILNDDSRPDRQLLAIKVLSDNPSPAGIDALCEAALWSENTQVKIAAYSALESRYEQDTKHLLEEYKSSHQRYSDDETDEEFEIEEEDYPSSSLDAQPDDPRKPQVPYTSSDAIIKNEGLGKTSLFLILVLLLVSGAALLFLFFRG